LALALALLAVLAQLWMGQISTRHLGQMLWQQTLWGEVCTAYNSPHTALNVSDTSTGISDSSDVLSRMANCPVCSIATAGLAPNQQPTLVSAVLGDTPYPFTPASAPERALRHAGLRPPAQAPPRA
jgi:guanyl-specific ribonuclease Sa